MSRAFLTTTHRRLSLLSRNYATESITAPLIKTAIPGPKSQAVTKTLSAWQDVRAQQFVADYPASQGNWIKDVDGNVMLDCFAQIASIAIGYNHPDLLKLARSDEFVHLAMNRPALGSFPPSNWDEIVQGGLGKVAPKGLNQLVTMMCGSCANEGALKAAFFAYRARERGTSSADAFTAEELKSCMENQKPGSPDLTVLSFKGGFHGRLFGTLSLTRSKAIHKIDVPAFDWPAVTFPQLQYPLEDHKLENDEAEARVLHQVEETIVSWKKKGRPVAAMIVEPVQSEGGDHHASKTFFQGLRCITREHGVYFIVDEVQTGVGASGNFWAHEKWDLDTPPDFVTFSKKMQAAGFYHTMETRPAQPYRQYNTWMGAPTEVMKARTIIDVIERDGLVASTSAIGDKLYSSLSTLSTTGPAKGQMLNLRGRKYGTFIAFDCESPEKRDKFVAEMRKLGVNMGGCGEKAVRLRPMLCFGERELDVLMERVEKVFKAGL